MPRDPGPTADADSPDGESLGRLVRSAHRGFIRALEGELAGSGLRSPEWSCLRVLWDADGLTGAELARALEVEKASLTQVLGSLMRKRFLRRMPDPEDRRKLRIYLTDAGRGLRVRLLPVAARVNRKAVRHLTKEEIAAVHSALVKMSATLGENDEG